MFELVICRVLLSFLFFFFSSRRRHTRWTGDWSSDVCSSDLPPEGTEEVRHLVRAVGFLARGSPRARLPRRHPVPPSVPVRSEERRVGKECRSRWSPYH